MTGREEVWIKAGYETVAQLGESGLKVEQLAKDVAISKSSFYHHFADLDVFVDQLLSYHVQRAEVIALKERQAKTINPELIDILVEHKIDLLFNRYLRIHANNASYHRALKKVDQLMGVDFVNLWIRDLKLQISKQQVEGLYELALKNFFLEINPDNLNRVWLVQYFENLRRITQNLHKPLDGHV